MIRSSFWRPPPHGRRRASCNTWFRARRIYETWARDFHVDGNPGRPLGPGRGRPFEIIVAPHRDVFFRLTHSDGADLPACDAYGHPDERHDVLTVADNLSNEPGPHGRIDWSANVLAHELFHAFQAGAMGHYPSEGLWWIEATAEWGGDDIFGFRLAPRGSAISTRACSNIRSCRLISSRAMVRATGCTTPTVWRFVQYLHSLMPLTGSDHRLFAYLVATFRAIGRGTPADEAIQTLFPAGVPVINPPAGLGGSRTRSESSGCCICRLISATSFPADRSPSRTTSSSLRSPWAAASTGR